jgi:hypothetical protein
MEINQEVSLVTDYEKLFRYSGMIDSLGASVKYILRVRESSNEATLNFVSQFNILRNSVNNCLREDLKSELNQFVPLLTNTSTLEEIFLEASQLSKFLDTIHQTPDFMLGLKVREINAEQVSGQIESSSKPMFQDKNVLHFGFHG